MGKPFTNGESEPQAVNSDKVESAAARSRCERIFFSLGDSNYRREKKCLKKLHAGRIASACLLVLKT